MILSIHFFQKANISRQKIQRMLKNIKVNTKCSDSRLIKLANELGSTTLRIGGTKQDITTFNLNGAFEKPAEGIFKSM